MRASAPAGVFGREQDELERARTNPHPLARDAAVPAARADDRVALEGLEAGAKLEGLARDGEGRAALDRHRPIPSPEPDAVHDLRPGRQRVVQLDEVQDALRQREGQPHQADQRDEVVAVRERSGAGSTPT